MSRHVGLFFIDMERMTTQISGLVMAYGNEREAF